MIVRKILVPLSITALSVIAIITLGLVPGAMAAIGIHKATKTGDI